MSICPSVRMNAEIWEQTAVDRDTKFCPPTLCPLPRYHRAVHLHQASQHHPVLALMWPPITTCHKNHAPHHAIQTQTTWELDTALYSRPTRFRRPYLHMHTWATTTLRLPTTWHPPLPAEPQRTLLQESNSSSPHASIHLGYKQSRVI